MVDTPIHPQASRAVLNQWSEITAALVDREGALHSNDGDRAKAVDREASLRDAGYHLSFLAQALALNHPAMFFDHVAWTKVMLGRREVPSSDLIVHFESLAEVLRERLPAESGALASDFVTAAVRAMPGMPDDLPTCLKPDNPLSPLAFEYFAALQRGERHLAHELIAEAVASGTPVKEIYLNVFQPVQHEVGRLWQTNRLTGAQEHYCTEATRDAISRLDPHLVAPVKNGRVMVATCVSGDQHEIGVRMVADFFEMDGWQSYYLGGGTPHADVIASLIDQHADVLAVSATIPHHVGAVRDLIRAVRAHPGCRRVTILVGGAPFNPKSEVGSTGRRREVPKTRGIWELSRSDFRTKSNFGEVGFLFCITLIINLLQITGEGQNRSSGSTVTRICVGASRRKVLRWMRRELSISPTI